MNTRHLRRVGALATIGALGMAGLAGTGAQAGVGEAARADAKITMELDGRNTFFEGPRTVGAGDELRIVNNTDPKAIGPHTFSLIDKKLYPEFSKEGFKECFKTGVCAQIFKGHDVNEKKETVGRFVVRAGEDGWDESFGRRGDSWFSFGEGEEFSQEVTAKRGSKLFYFCAIHPEMQGKIKVD